MAGDRNARLAAFHAGGTTRGLPARNPFFIQDGDAERAREAIRRGERDLANGVRDARKLAMERAAALIAASMRRNIAPDGRMTAAHIGLHEDLPKVIGEGRKMQRLKPATRARKKKHGGPRPILVDKGEMRSSVQSRAVQV